MANPIIDPRRQSFLESYYTPESASYSNAYKSAIDAGFSHSTAKDILYNRPQWLREKQGGLKTNEQDVLLMRLAQIIDDPGVTTRDKLKAVELMMKHYGMLSGTSAGVVQVNIQNVLD